MGAQTRAIAAAMVPLLLLLLRSGGGAVYLSWPLFALMPTLFLKLRRTEAR